MEKRIDVRATRNPSMYGDGVEIRLLDEGARAVAKPLVFEKHTMGNFVEPALVLPLPAAQRLMDELWVCGLRPTEGAGSAGSLLATQNHLEDMRTIAFGTLQLPKGGV